MKVEKKNIEFQKFSNQKGKESNLKKYIKPLIKPKFIGILLLIIIYYYIIRYEYKQYKQYKPGTNNSNNFSLTKYIKFNKPNIPKKFNYIHLALNMDNKYLYPCIVYLTSLLSNKANSTFYIIHILTGSYIRNETVYKINKTVEILGKNESNVSFYDMGNNYSRATSGGFISTATYYKLSLGSLLPNVDKIIYTDTDVINFKDLTEMYNIKFEDKMYFCCTLDYYHYTRELQGFKIFPEKYMNAGIFLMNLKAIREDKIEEKLKDFISTHFLNHHDQTAMNAVCANNIQILSYKYASFSFDTYDSLVEFNNEQNEKYRYSEFELKQSFYDPTLLHYPGWVKPYDKRCTNRKKGYWWYYAKMSLYYENILSHYGFEKEEIENLLKNLENGDIKIKNIYISSNI